MMSEPLLWGDALSTRHALTQHTVLMLKRIAAKVMQELCHLPNRCGRQRTANHAG